MQPTTWIRVVGIYSCCRRSYRCPQSIFCNILDVSFCTSLWLWIPAGTRGNWRHLFLEELGKSLLAPFMAQRQRMPHTPAAATPVWSAQLKSKVIKEKYFFMLVAFFSGGSANYCSAVL